MNANAATPSSTGPPGFSWYARLPTGVRRLEHRSDPLRQSISSFVHRLPAETEAVTDYSADPVISLEIAPDGAVERRIDGREERATLTTDTLTLTPAGVACEWCWRGRPLDVLDVYVPIELLHRAWSEQFGGSACRLNLLPKLCVDDPGLLLVMRSVLHAMRTPPRLSRLYYEALTQQLIALILGSRDHAARDAASPRGSLSERALRRVVEYIEENLAEDVTLEALARVAHVSHFHFLRQFKLATGYTPHRYLMQRRVLRARELLVTSSLSVTDVAVACGFGDVSHLAVRFRAVYGITPAAYRRVHS